MAYTLTHLIFDDSFYLGLRAYIDAHQMRFSVSKFGYVFRTHCFDVNTLV